MTIAGEYISDLVDTTPDGATERVRILDDHIRLLKHVLRTQFPNLGAVVITPTGADLNRIAGANAASGIQFLNAKAAVNGYAGLDAGAKVPLAQLPANITFPAGTRMLFQQTAAPTGWTKEVNALHDDAALRLTTGSVTALGGTGFIESFGSVRNTQVNNTNNIFIAGTFTAPVAAAAINHTHTFEIDVKYTDVIIATKDA